MIDLHCHYLPGVDDGAQDLAEALGLARAAVADGITHAVLTPHMHEGRFDNMGGGLRRVFSAFQAELNQAEIPLQLALAAEVRIGFEVLGWLQSEEIPFLGQHDGRPVMLLELPHGQIPPGSDKLTQLLMSQGVQPMIAHPERNKYILRDLDSITPFVEMGCLFQVTAGSIAGRFGPPARQRAVEMLERGWVHILATDAHNIDWRPPMLAEGRAAAAEVVGEEESWRLVRDNPWELSRGHFE